MITAAAAEYTINLKCISAVMFYNTEWQRRRGGGYCSSHAWSCAAGGVVLATPPEALKQQQSHDGTNTSKATGKKIIIMKTQ